MFKIIELSKKDWDHVYAKHAHEAVFEEPYDPSLSRSDYALLVVRTDKEEPVIYVTISEATRDGATIEYGGSFPNHRGSPLSFRAYQSVLKHLGLRYKQAYMMIRNDNVKMLKFALKTNFVISGFSIGSAGVPLLEHTLTFTKGNANG